MRVDAATRFAATAALLLGILSAAAALYGRYRVLPSWLTGPEVCRLEAGGCQALFRTRQAALLVLPNAAWGLGIYATIAVGLCLGWPAWLLFPAPSGARAAAGWLPPHPPRHP